jgi:4-hydroxy-2-oxoheptanedioate aldolase
MLRRNRVLERLRAGKYVLFFSPTPYASPKLIEMAGLMGFDGVWIDMEHQDYEYSDVFNMCLACRSTGMEAMVRIRKCGDHSIYRGFEAGATGLMIPHVKTAEEAQWVVRNAKFHPQGLRGMDGAEAAAAYALAPPRQYMEHANRETFVAVQIEDAEALENLDAIASTPGIDILFFGAQDMSQSLGIPWQLDDPGIIEARKKVGEAAKRHGKWWGCPADAQLARELYTECGATVFAGCAAIILLQEGLKRVRRDFSERLGD